MYLNGGAFSVHCSAGVCFIGPGGASVSKWTPFRGQTFLSASAGSGSNLQAHNV